MSPIFTFSSFLENNKTYYLAAGNFYGVQPYEGRYDAMNPTLFTYDNKCGQFVYTSQLPDINIEARDIKWIHGSGNKKTLALTGNNTSLTLLKPELNR